MSGGIQIVGMAQRNVVLNLTIRSRMRSASLNRSGAPADIKEFADYAKSYRRNAEVEELTNTNARRGRVKTIRFGIFRR